MKLKESKIEVKFERDGEEVILHFSLLKQNKLQELFLIEDSTTRILKQKEEVFKCLENVEGDLDVSVEDIRNLNISDVDFVNQVFVGYLNAMTTFQKTEGAEEKK